MVARRAVIRWAWRLLRREWRQQILILALIAIAVAATTVGVGVSANTPLSPYVGFGNAKDLATFQNDGAATKAKIASWRAKFGPVDVIENETVTVPGSIDTFDLRSLSSHSSYAQPLLSLVSGHLPDGAHQVALTSGVASELRLKVGSSWHEAGVTRTVVGIVENPENLLDAFALVTPGQVLRRRRSRCSLTRPGRRSTSSAQMSRHRSRWRRATHSTPKPFRLCSSRWSCCSSHSSPSRGSPCWHNVVCARLGCSARSARPIRTSSW